MFKHQAVRKILIALLILIGTLVLLGLGYAARIYYNAKYKPAEAFAKMNAAEVEIVMVESAQTANTQTVDNIPTSTPKPTSTDALVDFSFMQDRVNILVLGWDQSPEREVEGSALYRDDNNNFRSDVMILLSIDFTNNEADMISIPRDSYAPIYNTNGKWKINAAFAKGGGASKEGFTYAMNTVSKLFGDIPINYYVGVDMEGLKALVDAMGGVEYDVDVKIALNGRTLEMGMQHLDGQQVLDYCRARKGISTDIGRIDRQQRMLFAIFSQLKNTGQIVNIPKIYTAVSNMIWTNLNIEQIAALTLFATNLDMDNLSRHTLEGEYMTAYGISFYVLDQKAKVQLIKQIFGFEPDYNEKYDVRYVRNDERKRQEAAAVQAVAEQEATPGITPEAEDNFQESVSVLSDESEVTEPEETAEIEVIETEPVQEQMVIPVEECQQTDEENTDMIPIGK